ncbi:hypothetical protein FOZ60_008439, partial [Perkinsus olseni]
SVDDYSKLVGEGAITARFYNALTNRNPLFQRAVKFETEFYKKESEALWDLGGDDLFTVDFDTQVLDDILRPKTASRRRGVSLSESALTSRNAETWIEGTGYQYSLLGDTWYVVPNADDICFDNVRHMTTNWQSWVSSFGVDYNKSIDKFFNENPRLVGDPAFIHERFEQLYLLLNYADQLFSDSETTQESPVEREEVPRVKKIERAILSQRSAAERGTLFNIFLKERHFLNASTFHGSLLAPPHGWYLFNNSELIDRATRRPFNPPLAQFTDLQTLPWGTPSNYSARAVIGYCYDLLEKTMPSIAKPTYDAKYWTEVAFVTDGSCGSACSSFTQTLQLSGAATAFTFGGLADQPMDVAAFGGGDVLEYDFTSSGLNIASHLGYWATFGESQWSKMHANSWVNKPIPFPNSARVSYTWNIDLPLQLGPEALPRQLYIVPPHKHLNMWARDLEERAAIHKEIFPDLGYCPAYR